MTSKKISNKKWKEGFNFTLCHNLRGNFEIINKIKNRIQHVRKIFVIFLGIKL